MMEVFSVAAGAMKERLDPGHYRPVLVENDGALRRFGAHNLSELYLRSGIGHTAAVTPHYSSDGSGVAFISGGCIVAGQIDLAGAARIRRSAHAGVMSGSRLEPGLVLLVRKGELGNSAVVPSGTELNCSSEVMFLELRPNTDPGFVSSYFNTRQGRMAFLRQQRGMMITSISLYDVPALPVPRVDPLAQRCIGGKVRGAAKLRERAQHIVSRLLKLQNDLIPPFRPSRSRWSNFSVTPRRLTEVLVPHFYPPAVDEYLKGRTAEPLRSICAEIYSGETYHSVEWSDVGVDQATSRSCSGLFLKRPCNVVDAPNRADLDLHRHDLILTNAAHDKAYIGSDVTYFHSGQRTIPSAKVMVIRPDRARISASYLYAYLHTDVGYMQIQSAIRGISAGIRAEDVAGIRIPMPALSAKEHSDWLNCDESMAQAGESVEYAAELVRAAQMLVESLLDGRVSESDLVAAQRGLESGDRSYDRVLLQSIRLDNDTALFTDVDAIYALLDEAGKGVDDP